MLKLPSSSWLCAQCDSTMNCLQAHVLLHSWALRLYLPIILSTIIRSRTPATITICDLDQKQRYLSEHQQLHTITYITEAAAMGSCFSSPAPRRRRRNRSSDIEFQCYGDYPRAIPRGFGYPDSHDDPHHRGETGRSRQHRYDRYERPINYDMDLGSYGGDYQPRRPERAHRAGRGAGAARYGGYSGPSIPGPRRAASTRPMSRYDVDLSSFYVGAPQRW